MKKPEDLTVYELYQMVNDLHALMWAGDGCEICAHCEVVHREPYYKTKCKLDRGTLEAFDTIDCIPLWRGFSDEANDQ